MLKATMKKNGMWRRNDGKGRGITYGVTGSVAELAAFEKAQGQYFIKDENGAPLFVRREYSIIDGRRVRNQLKPVLTLGILRDGNGVFVDDSQDAINFDAKVESAMVNEVAKLQAMQHLGINIGDSQASAPARQVAAERTMTPEEILAQIELDAAGGGIANDGEKKPEGQDIPPIIVPDNAAGVGSLK